MNKIKKENSFIEKPLVKFDYIVFALLAIGCFFTFQNSDIVHTAASSYGYLNGHIFDFYDYNALFKIYDSYLPSTYIVFALWNLPLYIFGVRNLPQTNSITFALLMWNKLLPCLLYMVCGWLVYKIAQEIGMGRTRSKLCMYAFLTMPIGFFSQFIFGQYDIFTVFFVLLGFYFWLKDRDRLFILFFAISFTFKYFAFVIFVPLLLLKQKNIWRAIISLVASLVPVLVEVLIYLPSEVFREYVFGFSATSYVYNAGIMTGTNSVGIVVLLCGVIAAYSYFKTVSLKEELIKWALYLIGLMMFAIFGLSMWHPQWLLLMVPFFVLSAFVHNDTKIFMALDLMLMFFFTVYIVNEFAGISDEALFKLGIFGRLVDSNIGQNISISEILVFKDTDMALSFFTALILIMAFFKHPKDCLNDFSTDVTKGTMGFIRGRFLGGLAIFLVPAAICFVMAFVPPYVTFYTPGAYTDISGMIDREVTQVFIATKGKLESIEFQVGTYGRENDVTLNVSVKDADTGEEVFVKDISMSDCEDNEWVYVDTEDLQLEIGGTYRIDVSCYDADADNCVTLYRTLDIGTQPHGYAIIGGERQNYHLCIKITESNPS